jgi:2-dehydro-3-deoxygalactonokinase
MNAFLHTTKQFLSCDWGTSIFRLRLIETATLKTLAQESSNLGIATVFRQWQQSANANRLSFYLSILQQQILLLEQKCNTSLQALPVVVSGMASSTIGMMEIAYKDLPFATNGSDLIIEKISTTKIFQHDLYLLSGVKTVDDVMRGEETQVVGTLTDAEAGEQIIILPGTHSKHVFIKEGKAVSFHTYMTGELFELLSQKSLLAVSVEEGGEWLQEQNRHYFERGVVDSQEMNFLNACFRVRTNDLFQKMNRRQNYYYLSGLLIGTELMTLTNTSFSSLMLVSNETLKPLYFDALCLLLPGREIRTINADEAIVRGQLRIVSHLND